MHLKTGSPCDLSEAEARSRRSTTNPNLTPIRTESEPSALEAWRETSNSMGELAAVISRGLSCRSVPGPV